MYLFSILFLNQISCFHYKILHLLIIKYKIFYILFKLEKVYFALPVNVVNLQCVLWALSAVKWKRNKSGCLISHYLTKEGCLDSQL